MKYSGINLLECETIGKIILDDESLNIYNITYEIKSTKRKYYNINYKFLKDKIIINNNKQIMSEINYKEIKKYPAYNETNNSFLFHPLKNQILYWANYLEFYIFDLENNYFFIQKDMEGKNGIVYSGKFKLKEIKKIENDRIRDNLINLYKAIKKLKKKLN